MTIRLYLDEDSMRGSLLQAVRAHDVDVMSTQEAGMNGHSDEEQLQWASAQSRVLYSFNVADFYRLHHQWLTHGQSHSGIILATQQRYSVGEEMRRLLRLIAAVPGEEMHNKVEFLNSWN